MDSGLAAFAAPRNDGGVISCRTVGWVERSDTHQNLLKMMGFASGSTHPTASSSLSQNGIPGSRWRAPRNEGGEIFRYKTSCFSRFFSQVICPTGKKHLARKNLSSPACENIPLRDCPKSHLQFPPSRPTRGVSRSSRTWGMGCDGRTSPGALLARRAAVVRTAKSCGPGAPMQALSWQRR
jgi:hypothetical protein